MIADHNTVWKSGDLLGCIQISIKYRQTCKAADLQWIKSYTVMTH